MLEGLANLAPGQYKNLIDYYKKFDFYSRFALAPPKCETNPPYILPLDAAYADDRKTGGKGLHLSHLVHELELPVPAGFIISTSAWNAVLEKNGLRPKIDRLLAHTDIHSHSSLQETSAALSGYLRQAELPANWKRRLRRLLPTSPPNFQVRLLLYAPVPLAKIPLLALPDSTAPF